MTTTVIRIDGMSCGHCVNWIEQALRRIEGISEAMVDMERQQAKVSFDETTVTNDMMAEAIEKAGYKAAEFIDAG
ncbi:MAG: copper ion binding protein [Nitrospinota bacterium]|nr:copper ion binding protein [Nitrospinota bacterium]MDH5678658.1 copper ion binding protein [Nitrospinota bacterium]